MLLASLVCGCALVAAAALKVAEPAASRVALATYGVTGALARPAWTALVVVEAALGALLLAGIAGVHWVAAAVFAGFAVAQVVVLARGGGGAPCGCLGARGRVSWASVARAGLLAAVAALAGPGSLWAAAVGIVVAAVAATLLRRAPRGALDVASEGPAVGSVLAGAPEGLLLFTADGCSLCARVRRGLGGLGVTELDEERDAALWHAARVPGAPYAVLVGASGVVRAKGTVNTAAQVRSLLGRTSRRGFLGRTAGAAAAVAGAQAIGSLVRPGEAEAYHFCGHIYTTDSCPHPTGLPRIDAKGYPLRARDGHRVDDLGRLVDLAGRPVGEDGEPLVDPDGRPLPVATRTKVCAAVARRYGFKTQVDGAWYRCCKGHVRKLIDCCSQHDRRINGDAALTGYCYKGRKVFCVMYHQTKVPC